ncbi:MAG TPA: hypothetical protein DEF18_10020 [Muricauda sp.]|uniref:DUF2871 domain-containing protein n=1 Tax=Flagellimonas aurea TaxID=2915619 RepID=A0ABS3G3P5_9FLAO|nr:hypothetical protein [Allomuricauda aurea]MAO16677.1 hypothetical protein [Allomuricauda sp.]UBZ13692.1 hypothetical protein LDL77_17635 [Allomuricauda aquimarina]MBC73771.1 hypothetical protein [Allomuricauda sp.]MBO0353202.1 hypothetical protein [Allomuricauda aurea]HBU78428.1 hypothetical protein [Allomuricauda sp.]
MNKFFKKPYISFWVTIPVLLLIGFLKRSEVVSLNIHDIYLIINFFHFTVLISIFFGLVGLGYWMMYLRRKRLSIWLNFSHMVITILGLGIIWLLSHLIKDEATHTSMETFNYNRALQTIIQPMVLLVIIGQFVYFFNLIRGLVLNQRKRP